MKEKRYPLRLVVLNAAFSFLLAGFIINAVQFGRCFYAAKRTPAFDCQLLRIRLYNSGGTSVSASVSILDSDGAECAVIERSWHGSFLAAEFMCASFSEKSFYFPERLYGTNCIAPQELSAFTRRKHGTNLFPYYNERSECLLLGRSRPIAERMHLYTLSSFASSSAAIAASGFIKRYTVNFAGCEEGRYYGVFIDSAGNISVKEE